MKKIWMPIILLATMMVLVFVPTVAMAATDAQDGLTATLTMDKSAYNVGDTAMVSVSVTNTDTGNVSGIKIDLSLPSGLTLAAGQSSVNVGTLAAGETKTYTMAATATSTVTDTSATGTGTSPKTGDSSSIALWIVIAAVAATVGVLLYRKKILPTKLFTLLLCLVVVFSAAFPVGTAFAAQEERSFTISESVTVGGESKTVFVKITYIHEGKGSAVAVTNVSISPTIASLTAGGTKQLTATIAPTNATNQAVTWASDNTTVATVNSNGLVTAVSAGTATVTATTADGGKTAACVITVTAAAIPVTGVTVSPTTASLTAGGTQQLTATIAPTNATNQAVTWASDNTTVATVNSNGLVTAAATGNATITATTADGSHTDTCTVEVLQEYAFSVTVDGQSGGSIVNTSTADGDYIAGTQIEVTVTSDAGYKFKEWQGAPSGASSTREGLNTTITFRMPESGVTLVAVFETAVIYAVGDYYPDPGNSGTAIGKVFEVSGGGIYGKIVDTTSAAGQVWGPDTVTTGATNETDGLSNMAVITSIGNWETDYPVFAWVHSKNSPGTIYSPGATEIWYLPSKDELMTLKGSGVVGFTQNTWSSTENSSDISQAWSFQVFNNAALPAHKGFGYRAFAVYQF